MKNKFLSLLTFILILSFISADSVSVGYYGNANNSFSLPTGIKDTSNSGGNLFFTNIFSFPYILIPLGAIIILLLFIVFKYRKKILKKLRKLIIAEN